MSIISKTKDKNSKFNKIINAQTNMQSIILISLYLIFGSFILTLVLNLFQYQSFTVLIENLSINFTSFLLTFFLILILNVGVYFISSSVRGPLILVMLPIVVLAIVNHKKFFYRQEVLVPMDFLQIKEALNIVSTAVKINLFTPKYIALFALIIIAFAVTFFIKKKKIKIRFRILSALIFPILTYFYVFSPNCLVNKISPSYIYENTNQIYERRGFLVAFLNEIPNMILLEPDNYTKENVEDIYNSMSNNTKNATLDDSTPNIIVILSEALTDPLNLSGVTYSIDPLNSVREYMNTIGHLNMISPQTGGGTANVEYEVLTGVSVTLFDDVAIAYQQYINSPHFSIASYLNDKGYVSLAIHPYEDWFWRRNKVYPYLGFRDFYSMYEMNNKEYMGPFISDLSLSKEIIEKYEENSDSPVFINGISIQNHLPHNQHRYSADETKVTIESDTISDGFKSDLTEYVNGVYYASEALSYLIDYFKEVDEPTYIVMYGDHGPYFADYVDEYYKALGFESDKELDYLLYETPVIFWSNQEEEPIETNYISSFLLGKEILKFANVELPDYFNVLEKFNESIRAVNRRFVINSKNDFIYKSEYTGTLVNDVNLIGYDINFGKNYLNYNISGQ